jgi:hypothetical protein
VPCPQGGRLMPEIDRGPGPVGEGTARRGGLRLVGRLRWWPGVDAEGEPGVGVAEPGLVLS